MANEKRLIDANKLIIAFKDYAKSQPLTLWNAFELEVMLNHFPTVDAVEVVHARWEKVYVCQGERLWAYGCERCKAENGKKSNYCPNCGAKMEVIE